MGYVTRGDSAGVEEAPKLCPVQPAMTPAEQMFYIGVRFFPLASLCLSATLSQGFPGNSLWILVWLGFTLVWQIHSLIVLFWFSSIPCKGGMASCKDTDWASYWVWLLPPHVLVGCLHLQSGDNSGCNNTISRACYELISIKPFKMPDTHNPSNICH